VAFAAPYPGHIIPVDLGIYRPLLSQRGLLSLFGPRDRSDRGLHQTSGAGFSAAKASSCRSWRPGGPGFVHAGGTVFERDLQAGQSLRVDTGCLVAFQESVDYDIQMASGIKDRPLRRGRPVSARLTGPGKVWLQSLPFFAHGNRIYAAVGGSSGETKRGGGLSNLVGDLLGGKD
jgi:uncharacterized protein (AIM24 family)